MDLKYLFQNGTVRLAKLPAMNEFAVERLDDIKGYTVPLIEHDYAAKTPVMWNTVYEQLGLPIRNIMVEADPKDAKTILDTLKKDPKYLGGGAGVGFKEAVIPFLDKVVPQDLNSVNIIVKENGQLVGYNTDAQGLYISVENALKSVNKKAEGSNYIILGAGGVAKEFARHLAKGGANRIGIINRTFSKAVALAHELNTEYSKELAYAVPEDLIRGTVLNTTEKPDAIINTTTKGSDGKLEDTSAFAMYGQTNNTISIGVLRNMAQWNPKVAIVDITLPKSGRSVTLRHAESAGLENLVDGIPMVINQGGPAYKLIEASHPQIHTKTATEEEILNIMTKAAQ